MFDYVVVLDESLRCPHGHPVGNFQTKSFADPTMSTYLLEGPNVYLVARGGLGAEAANWRLEGDEAVFQRRHAVERIVPPREIISYTSCSDCTPLLVRCDQPRAWRDLLDERQLWVEFRVTFGPDGQRRIERTSGTREDLAAELRENGLRVMRDDEPLAAAHLEIRAARDPGRRHRSRANL